MLFFVQPFALTTTATVTASSAAAPSRRHHPGLFLSSSSFHPPSPLSSSSFSAPSPFAPCLRRHPVQPDSTDDDDDYNSDLNDTGDLSILPDHRRQRHHHHNCRRRNRYDLAHHHQYRHAVEAQLSASSPPPSPPLPSPPPSQPPPPVEPLIASMKQRTVITLRGLSDLAGLALVAEFSRRMLFIPGPAYALLTDAELLLGGLVGLWTAAVFAGRPTPVLKTTTPVTTNPTSSSSSSSSIAAQTNDLTSAWDASFIYHPELDADEIPAALAWLDAFDELEGLGTIELLRNILNSTSIDDNHHRATSMRVRLAHALASHPVRSNVTLSAVVALATDSSHPRVQAAGMAALQAYCAAGIVSFDSVPSLMAAAATSSTEQLFDLPQLDGDMLLCQEEFVLLKHILNRIVSNPNPVPVPLPPMFQQGSVVAIGTAWWLDLDTAWVNDTITRHVTSMRDAALSQPDLPNLAKLAPRLLSADGRRRGQGESSSSTAAAAKELRTAQQMDSVQQQVSSAHAMHFMAQQQAGLGNNNSKFNNNNGGGQFDSTLASEDNVDVDSLRSATPLVDSLVKEEIHGICALATLPAAYELFAAFNQELLPLRFLGLGWLLALGGLVAYPNSAKLWSSFSLTIQRESRPQREAWKDSSRLDL